MDGLLVSCVSLCIACIESTAKYQSCKYDLVSLLVAYQLACCIYECSSIMISESSKVLVPSVSYVLFI